MTTVVMVGATGMLGSAITKNLLKRGARIRALLRPADSARPAPPAGVDTVEGDILEPADRLARALEGADVVVSAVQGGADVVTGGQANLVRAAGIAGVPRMVPSDFSVDLFRLDDGDNVFLDHRRRAAEAFAGSAVRPTSVLNGAFLEVMTAPFLELVDWDAGTFSLWGDGDQPVDLTTVADAAEYAAAAALDPDAAGRPVRVAGEVVTMKGFQAALERGTGRTLTTVHRGGTGELWAEIQRRKAAGADVTRYVALQYLWSMVTGKAKLEPLDNGRYPEIRPTGVEEFARRLRLPAVQH